ncbi:MAG: hypothetical protein ACI9W2_004166, partial [Gammaproteobacteria bacterium]
GRIFPSRALLAARSATLGLGLVISRHSLSFFAYCNSMHDILSARFRQPLKILICAQ